MASRDKSCINTFAHLFKVEDEEPTEIIDLSLIRSRIF